MMKTALLALAFVLVSLAGPAHAETHLTKSGRAFYVNGKMVNAGSPAAGMLVNARMVNAVFEDTKRPTFNPQANTNEFLARIPDYMSAGVNAFTISLQGGNPGYEGAKNTGINPDGTLKASYMSRIAQVIDAANAKGAIIILGIYYQRQDQYVRDQAAIKAGVVNVMKWVVARGYKNVIVEVANEYGHSGFDHAILRSASGVASLINLAKQTAPGIMVTASGYGDGILAKEIIAASSVLVIHLNGVDPSGYAKKINALKSYNKPILCNEDPKAGSTGATAASSALNAGSGWGYLHRSNQDYPFSFKGPTEASTVYNRFKALTARQ
jgi:cellulase (glycosyl hydrolase family 5)